MGNYYCDICHLFDDEDKQQFHCDKCNICRVGGKDNFIHCDTCNLCIKDDPNHTCISAKDAACPICMDDLFTSTLPFLQMKCGHRIHKDCFSELIKTSYKCPLCSTSLGNMESFNNMLAQEISMVPMPQELNYNVSVLCNDCHEHSETPFHIIALKCLACNGYNTRRV
jgi:RING finger/CHY zinc finger protein 1